MRASKEHFRVEALVAYHWVVQYKQAWKWERTKTHGKLKLHMTGSKIVASTNPPLWHRLYSTSRSRSRELVMVGNRGSIVEGYQTLASCFTNVPTVTARGYVCPARARRSRHPNECSGHLSQCFTPQHHSLLLGSVCPACAHARTMRATFIMTFPDSVPKFTITQ